MNMVSDFPNKFCGQRFPSHNFKLVGGRLFRSSSPKQSKKSDPHKFQTLIGDNTNLPRRIKFVFFSLFKNNSNFYTKMNAPALRLEEFSSFRPIESSSSSDIDASSSFDAEPLSPLAIFRDGENGASSMHMVRRANPIDSMDCSNHGSVRQEDCAIWADVHQRVISPFPADEGMHWKDVAAEQVDFSHFFPTGHAGVMDCDDFSLSSAEASDDLVLADDLTNPESFWESGSNIDSSFDSDNSRSPSPAQVSIDSNSLFPPSPTSTTQVHELETDKPRLMPC